MIGRPQAGATRMPGPGDTFAESGVALIRERCDVVPEVAVVLGSGLGDAVGADLEACHQFSFQALPGFPPSTVPGHAGRLALGRLYGAPAAVFFGRIHYYEGHGIQASTLIPRLAAALGTGAMVLTNAAGGLDPTMRPGQLMMIADHINMMGVNPLMGWRTPEGAPAFADLSAVYPEELRDRARTAAATHSVDLATGVYVAVAGPSYETPAEIAFFARAGGQAVGMSTVPEAVAAAALGMPVLGLSCITNVAGAESSHEDVLEMARRASPDLRAILMGVVGAGPDPEGPAAPASNDGP